jgi:hypothetical protein
MIGMPKFTPTSIEMSSSNGDKIRIPGIVRVKSRIRFEIGIRGIFPARSIKGILPDVVG